MFLVELVMQGIRGFSELVRMRFPRGFALVLAANDAGKTTALDTVLRLLYPDERTEAAVSLISRRTPDASRGAVVVSADDGTYYRVIQDFSKRGVNLSRYDAASKTFTLLQKDWPSAAKFAAALTADIGEADFERIFLYRRDRSGAPVAASPAATAGASPAVATAAAPGPPGSDQARLAQLREALRKADEAADAEYAAQNARLERDDTAKILAKLEEQDAKIADLDADLAEYRGFDSLPENLWDQMDEYERREVVRNEEAADLDNEREGLSRQLAATTTVQFTRDALFIAGAAVGVLSFLSVFVLPTEYSRFFPVGLVLAVMLMAIGWYNASRKNAHHRMLSQDLAKLEMEITAREEQFQKSGASVTGAMQAVGVENLGELKNKAESHRYLRARRAEMAEQRQRLLGDNREEALRERLAVQEEEVRKREEAARALAPFNIDVFSIKQEMERLEGGSGSADTAAGGTWDFGAPEETPVAAPALPLLAAASGEAGVGHVLAAAARISGIEMDTLIPAVEAAAQRSLTSATNGQYVRIEVGQEGAPVVQTRFDERLPFSDLSHGTQDLVLFCLRAGIVEALVGKRRMPFLLDDPFVGLDPARQKAACQVLRALGAKTQVILFASEPALRSAGDAVVELR